jgi:hypothetical protein
MNEKQVTSGEQGHILTNIGIMSTDSRWPVYDLRVDGEVFSGTRIERVNVDTGEVERLYQSANGACCGSGSCWRGVERRAWGREQGAWSMGQGEESDAERAVI